MTPTDTTAAPPTELTVAEVAEKYGVNKRSLLQAIYRGQVPARKVGTLYLVDAEAARLYGEVYKARRALDAYTGYTTDSDAE